MAQMNRLWHPVRVLPSPGVPLCIKLRDGRVVDGVRPKYITNYEASNLGYHTADGWELTTDTGTPDDAIEWSIA